MISSKKIITKNNAPYLFMAPALILFSLFTVYPFIKTFILSFQVRLNGEYVFSGFTNYFKFIHDQVFLAALQNTFIFLIFQVPVMIFLALLIAVFLNSRILRWKGQFRTIYFLPAVTELVAYSIVFFLLLSNRGLINYLISFFGIDSVEWLTSPVWSKVSIMIALTWRWTGYHMVIMLAGLQNIPETLYEAASIDRAGKINQFFHVTIPQMRPIILFSVVLATISTINLFSEPFILTKGGPANATMTLGLYLYKQAFDSFNFGYASAISVVVLIITICFSYVQVKFGGKDD